MAGALDGLVRFPPGFGIGLRTTGPHGLRVHPGVMPGWDNTPRRGSAAHAFHRGNPVSFRRWLSRAVDAASTAGGEPLVFVNAWNEWAEGAYLEPDVRFGRANLETVRQVTGARPRRPDSSPSNGKDGSGS